MGEFIYYDPRDWNMEKMAKKVVELNFGQKGALKKRLKEEGKFKATLPFIFNINLPLKTWTKGLFGNVIYTRTMDNALKDKMANSVYDIFCKNMKPVGMNVLPYQKLVANAQFQEMLTKMAGSPNLVDAQHAMWVPGDMKYFNFGQIPIKEEMAIQRTARTITRPLGGDSVLMARLNFGSCGDKKNVYAPALVGFDIKYGELTQSHNPYIWMKMAKNKKVAYHTNEGLNVQLTNKELIANDGAYVDLHLKMWDDLSKMFAIRVQEVYDKFM